MYGRAGILKKNLSGEAEYLSFVPTPLPLDPPITVDDEMLVVLVKANQQLTLLDGLASRIPDVNLFVSMYVRKEALLSSQIEGTQATLEDVLNPSVDANTNLRLFRCSLIFVCWKTQRQRLTSPESRHTRFRS